VPIVDFGLEINTSVTLMNSLKVKAKRDCMVKKSTAIAMDLMFYVFLFLVYCKIIITISI